MVKSHHCIAITSADVWWGLTTSLLHYYCMCVWSDQWPHPPRATARPPRRHTSIPQLPPGLPLPSSTHHSSSPPTTRRLKVVTSAALHKVTVVCRPACFLLVTFLCVNPLLHEQGMTWSEQTRLVFNLFTREATSVLSGWWKVLVQITRSRPGSIWEHGQKRSPSYNKTRQVHLWMWQQTSTHV